MSGIVLRSLVVALALGLVNRPLAVSAGATPTPRLLDRLSAERATNAHWRIATPAGPLELRVRQVTPAAVVGDGAPARTIVPWDQISRIEQRHSPVLLGRSLGAVVGATALGYAGASIGNGIDSHHSHGDAGAWTGLAIGAVAGAWAGGAIGDHPSHASWRLLYDAGDSAEAGDPRAWAARVRPAVRRGSPLRLTGDFGTFSGYVGEATDRGLSGLLAIASLDSPLPMPAEPIAWSTLHEVEVRGTATRRGAWIGAALLGVLTSVSSAAVSAGLGNDGGSAAAAGFLGAVVGGGAGAAGGALVGHAIPMWHRLTPP